MPAKVFLDWFAYSQVEPFGSVFDDAIGAHVVQTTANLHRDRRKHPQAFPLERFLLIKTGKATPRKQTWQEQKRILNQMLQAFLPPKANASK